MRPGLVLCKTCRVGHLLVALLWLVVPSLKQTTATSLPAAQAQLPFLLQQYPPTHRQQTSDEEHRSLPESNVNLSQKYAASLYADHILIRIKVNGLDDQAAVDLLQELENSELDIWQRRRHQHVDVRVQQSFFASDLYELYASRIEILVSSLDTLVRTEQQSQAEALSFLHTQSHSSLVADPSNGLHSLYHPYAAIESLLQLFANDYPEYAKLENIGTSAEGRDMWSLRVSDYRTQKHALTREATDQGWRTLSRKALRTLRSQLGSATIRKPKQKLGFAFMGGQHAREWISPASLIYIAHELVTSASQPSSPSISAREQADEIKTLLSEYELHFIVVANPDGYVYAWEHDRLWVRSRQFIGSNETRCHGIDMNRNWAYKFEKAYRPNPCSDLYPGTQPFESRELQVISQYLERMKKTSRLDVFLDIHSFGQLIMYPYSFSCSEVPPDAENLFEALLRASKAIRNVHKQNYDVGGVCDVSYTATGQSLDWTYKTLGAKWSFAANLRDQGVYAFMLPPDQIVPTGQEMLAGLLDMAKFIAQKEKIEN